MCDHMPRGECLERVVVGMCLVGREKSGSVGHSMALVTVGSLVRQPRRAPESTSRATSANVVPPHGCSSTCSSPLRRLTFQDDPHSTHTKEVRCPRVAIALVQAKEAGEAVNADRTASPGGAVQAPLRARVQLHRRTATSHQLENRLFSQPR